MSSTYDIDIGLLDLALCICNLCALALDIVLDVRLEILAAYLTILVQRVQDYFLREPSMAWYAPLPTCFVKTRR